MVEKHPLDLTKSEANLLGHLASLPRGGYANWGAMSNTGGSKRRMCERMFHRGLVTKAPFKITVLGRTALLRYRASQRRASDRERLNRVRAILDEHSGTMIYEMLPQVVQDQLASIYALARRHPESWRP